MAEDFFARLKQIIYILFINAKGAEHLFLHASLRNFLNAIFSNAVHYTLPFSFKLNHPKANCASTYELRNHLKMREFIKRH